MTLMTLKRNKKDIKEIYIGVGKMTPIRVMCHGKWRLNPRGARASLDNCHVLPVLLFVHDGKQPFKASFLPGKEKGCTGETAQERCRGL